MSGEEGVIYRCVRCGEITTQKYIEEMYLGRIKCSFCGYKVLKKVRPPRVKIIKAI